MRADYATLQDNAIQHLTQMDSDARLTEMREQLMQIRAASESTEEKLRSEVRINIRMYSLCLNYPIPILFLNCTKHIYWY